MNDNRKKLTNSFASLDCVDMFFDGPGDSTVRPLRPSLLRLALAERERLARYQDSSNGDRASPGKSESDS